MNDTLYKNSSYMEEKNNLFQTTQLIQTSSLGAKINLIAYCYILPAICVFGIIGNIMNLITLASKRLKAVSYMYLKALAIADLLCMLFVLFFVTCEILTQLGYSFNKRYSYGFYQAHLMLPLINWALATGVYVVVALSIERFVSIVFPLKFRTWNSPTRAMKAIIIAYIFPAVIYIPYALGRYSVGSKTTEDGQVIYMPIDSDISQTFEWQIYKWTREGLLRFVPIIALSILNGKIMFAFKKRQKMFKRLTKKQGNNSNKDENLLYLLGGIVVMFFICNIPAAVNLVFINETVKKRVDYQLFRAVANILEITNHASQFYIFCTCSSSYRVTFLRKFPCFKGYTKNREKLRTYLRRTPTNKSLLSCKDSVSAIMISEKNAIIKHGKKDMETDRIDFSISNSGNIAPIEQINFNNITSRQEDRKGLLERNKNGIILTQEFALRNTVTTNNKSNDQVEKSLTCRLASLDECVLSDDSSQYSFNDEKDFFKNQDNNYELSNVYL
uniref:G_PROTEIN_RECEP_F1_2 domain-containing protein n=1 Tax=Parastrongyloides trichosuri TaxID=131310 RepID=A0A0N4ZRN2_PARTI